MFTSIQIRLERAGHCQRCEYYHRTTKQCNQCGCFINLKVTLADSECPIGKWKKAPVGNDLVAELSHQVQKLLYKK